MIRVLLFLLVAVPAWADNVSLRFDSVRVDVLAKAMFSEVLQKPYVIEDGIGKKTVSLQLQEVPRASVAVTVARVLEASDIDVREDSGIYFIGPRRTGDLVIYRPRYRSASSLLELARQAFPDVTPTAVGTADMQEKKEEPASRVSALIQNPSKDDLGLVVLRLPPMQARAARELFLLADTAQAQLYIRAAAYDVNLDAGTGTSVDLALSLLGGRLGVNLSGPDVGKAAQAITFKNTRVDLLAHILDSDTRFKSLSRPAVRVRSGARARFSVGQEVPTLGGVTTNVGGATQSVVYRPAGIIFEVTPQVREGAIDVELKQTISSFRVTETSQLNSPTLAKRELETVLSMQPGEVVMVAGLDSDEETGSGRSLFGIPLGKTEQRAQRQTLLILEVIPL